MKNYSVAIYGSSTRENFDKYSDKDILIVAQSYNDLKALRTEYENQGFSVSAYTYSKLNFMSENGSLFIDHLVKESKIIFDNESKFSSILNNHKSKKPELKQFQENKKYFEILKFVPNSKKGFGWFCDCFYVGIRNYLILKSAEKGNFNFSYLTLLDEIKNEGFISEKDVKILRELRVVKRNYRERINNELPSKYFISKIVKIAKKLDLLTTVNISDEFEFQNFIESSLITDEYNHYQKLRLIEMYYHSKGIENKEIERIICNPQFYASFFKEEKYVLNIIGKIAKNKKTSHNWQFGNMAVKELFKVCFALANFYL
ncbi:hypothetical protein FLACOL_01362 [Flavobacterium columnare]|uniref:Polymerase nucleotidyl transferase domain-containing protein n=2 Tax=Flavobacterium TaxID=237 RepID=A0ABW8PM22_9FLAO|nr:hypothetical protein [Flavobacterium columnare]SPE77369.1 hypothetical protein FLACOL_01362 [Flavobacterium columnare]